MSLPERPKIYHIVHVDRVESIVADGYLWCDAEVVKRPSQGTTIGMSDIKKRRLTELALTSHPGLYVGACVPFYFCPRSVMLYLLYKANHPGLTYRGGQEPVVHLEADLHTVVTWAHTNSRRWAFTLQNAGSRYFEDRCSLEQLDEIDWKAIRATQWTACKEQKQAEFLLEYSFPWQLVERVGVKSPKIYRAVSEVLPTGGHRPPVEVRSDWYY